MKGYRFYEEIENKGKKDEKSNGNVIALFLDENNDPTSYPYGPKQVWSGLGAVYFHENSPVSVTGISPDYLREDCKRVSEEKAREIHPRLFERLVKEE